MVDTYNNAIIEKNQRCSMSLNKLEQNVFYAKLELIKTILIEKQSLLKISRFGVAYNEVYERVEGAVIVSEWNLENCTVVLRCPLYEIESSADNILSVLLQPECLRGYSTFREGLHNQLYPTFSLAVTNKKST